ncbi:MAG TPA: RbsD/FucU domain-containing protein [Actinomycetales bacterium]|nr:RbsD/FucU domain-containing protein [Actinomycetales bacterium]
MLKNVDPLLTGALLRLLDEMGHGDVLGLVDRNFPAHRYGRPVFDLRASDTEAAGRAVLSVLPLDGFVDSPIVRMQIDGSPEEVSSATARLRAVADDAERRSVSVGSLERFAFYEAAKEATAFVQTGETVPYSCYLLRKGVV